VTAWGSAEAVLESAHVQKFAIPQEVSRVTEALEASGFKAYLVGGCVRDLILGRTPKDWDVTTNATPEEIQAVFGEEDSFYENTFGTVGVVNRETADETLRVVEVTPFRTESGYSDFRRPDEVKFSQKLEDDLLRRDFTVNAIALSKGQLVDPFKGQEDIAGKVLRAVGEADRRFSEDALRMLRAIRLSAELDFSIETDTAASIASNAKLLGHVSRERVRDEFTRLVLSDKPMVGLELANRLGLLEHLSPHFCNMVGVEQGKEAHKYDVWEHSLRSLQHAADKGYSLEIRLAALMHDIAKPPTKRVEDGQTTFYGHEVVGARIAKAILQDLRYPKELVETVVTLVRWHMFFSDPDKITLSAVRRIISKVGQDRIWDLVNLRICDRIGTGRPMEEPYRLRKYKSMIDEALRDPVSVKMLAVNGETLMELGIPVGPKYGHILHALLELVLDDPSLNTRETLSARALELAALPDAELEALGMAGRESKDEEEGKELAALRRRHDVR
jgi:tRNA nucleotidyltransferase (CCA-adding enzyme)